MHGVAKGSGVRRCVRRAGAAPSCAALFLQIFVCVDTLGEAGSKAWHDCVAQGNAGADVVQAHI